MSYLHTKAQAIVKEYLEDEIKDFPEYPRIRELAIINTCFRRIKRFNRPLFECFNYETKTFDILSINECQDMSGALDVEEQRALVNIYNEYISSAVYKPMGLERANAFAETLVVLRDEADAIEKCNLEKLMFESGDIQDLLHRMYRAEDLLDGGAKYYRNELRILSSAYQTIYEMDGRRPCEFLDKVHAHYREFLETEYDPSAKPIEENYRKMVNFASRYERMIEQKVIHERNTRPHKPHNPHKRTWSKRRSRWNKLR